MPSIAEISQFLGGQILQTPPLPTQDFTGQTIVITGANSGLGFDCAKHLVRLNITRLILACRNNAKGEAAKTALQKIQPRKNTHRTSIEVWSIDLASFESVSAFASRAASQLDRLDGVVANAGIDMLDFELGEGYESTLTVNVISTFLLALLVLSKLRETGRKHNVTPHLTVVGSMIHVFAPAEQLSAAPKGHILESLSNQSTADMPSRYFLSKLIVTQCVQEFAKLVTATSKTPYDHVVVNDVNPGWCKTELFRQDDGGLGGRIGLSMIGRTSEKGSRNLVYAIAAGKETHGQYVSECKVKQASDFVKSKKGIEIQQSIWGELMDIFEKVVPGVTEQIK